MKTATSELVGATASCGPGSSASNPSRRGMFGGAAAVVSASAIATGATAQASRTAGNRPRGLTDADIFNFALNLEYLEAEYYSYAVHGRGIASIHRGGNGKTTGGLKAKLSAPILVRLLLSSHVPMTEHSLEFAPQCDLILD